MNTELDPHENALQASMSELDDIQLAAVAFIRGTPLSAFAECHRDEIIEAARWLPEFGPVPV